LRPGQGHADGTRYVWCEPDAGVRLLLEAYRDRELAQAAAEIIRSWKDEDPRALWERLRAEGPARCPSVGVAAFCISYGWGNGGIPGVNQGWNGGWSGPGARPTINPPSIVQLASRADSLGGLPATIHPDAREVEPREVARWGFLGHYAHRQGQPESGFSPHLLREYPRTATNNGNKPRTAIAVARRLLAGHALPASIHPDAREVEPPTLPPGTVAYMDPPYLNTTGYAHDLGRDEVVRLARRWADAGATVCISEAEPIPELLADGWHAIEITGERKGQRRTFSKQQAEWLTLNRAPAWVPSVQASLFGAA
jgi:hypothetical protein